LLSAANHETDFVDQEFAGFAEIVDFAGPVKKIGRDPDGLPRAAMAAHRF
jgi:hypothetical protein